MIKNIRISQPLVKLTATIGSVVEMLKSIKNGMTHSRKISILMRIQVATTGALMFGGNSL